MSIFVDKTQYIKPIVYYTAPESRVKQRFSVPIIACDASEGRDVTMPLVQIHKTAKVCTCILDAQIRAIYYLVSIICRHSPAARAGGIIIGAVYYTCLSLFITRCHFSLASSSEQTNSLPGRAVQKSRKIWTAMWSVMLSVSKRPSKRWSVIHSRTESE